MCVLNSKDSILNYYMYNTLTTNYIATIKLCNQSFKLMQILIKFNIRINLLMNECNNLYT